MRRLPVYLVVDSSESTLGEAHDAIVLGVTRMLEHLRMNPYALETVWLSVITFDGSARVVTPLTDVGEFMVPEIRIHPGTALGAAVDLLRERLRLEIVRTTEDRKGDWKPLVFFFTDGQPTDEWEEAVKRFKESRPRPAHVCAIGCGDDVDFSVLRKIADETYKLDASTESGLRGLYNSLFEWVTASVENVNTMSRAVNETPRMDDALPRGLSLVKDDAPTPAQDEESFPFPRQVFLHRICSETGKDYVVRFTRDVLFYESPRSFKVDKDFFTESDLESPTIPGVLFQENPVCPYCGNDNQFFCSCGAVLCHDGDSPITCVKCGETASEFSSYDGDFETSEG